MSKGGRLLATEGPIRREVVGQIERRDVALLTELGRGVLAIPPHLTRVGTYKRRVIDCSRSDGRSAPDDSVAGLRLG